MADQDFKINIRTVADTTGIQLTRQQLSALQLAAKQGNAEAIAAMQKLKAAQQEVSGSLGGGLSGTALGIGTIITLLTGAISKWKQFSDEQDKIIEKMFEATAKMREEALAVAAIKDLDFSEELIKQADSVEQLEANFGRLTGKIATLKGEQDALDPLTEAKEWKELRTEINAYESQLKSVQSTLQQKGVKDLVLRPGAGPKAGKGQSQALVDEIERNRKAAEDQLKEDIYEVDPETGGLRRTGQKRFPLFQPLPQPPEQPDWITGAGKIGGPDWKALIKQAFDESMSKYWGP